MITLLIVSVALAVMAPLLTKKTNVSSASIQINPEIDVPIGAIMFFHPGVSGYKQANALNPCPPGWTQLPTNFNNRFIRISDGRGGSRNYGTYEEDAFKEHVHITTWGENIYNYTDGETTKNFPWGYYWPDGVTNKNQIMMVGSHGGFDYDDAWSYTSPPALRTRRDATNGYYAKFLTGEDYTETRPKNVALLACVKGPMPDNHAPEDNTIPNEVTGQDK